MKTFRDIFTAKTEEDKDKIISQQTPWFMSEVKQYLSTVPKDGPFHVSLTFKSLKTEPIKVDQEFIFVKGKVSSVTEKMTTGKPGAEKVVERSFINVNDTLIEEKDLKKILDTATHARKEHHQPEPSEVVTQRTKSIAAKLSDPKLAAEQKHALLMVLATEPPGVENATASVENRLSVVQTQSRRLMQSSNPSPASLQELVELVNRCKVGVEPADYEFAKINHTKEILSTSANPTQKPQATPAPDNVVPLHGKSNQKTQKEVSEVKETTKATNVTEAKKNPKNPDDNFPEVN